MVILVGMKYVLEWEKTRSRKLIRRVAAKGL